MGRLRARTMSKSCAAPAAMIATKKGAAPGDANQRLCRLIVVTIFCLVPTIRHASAGSSPPTWASVRQRIMPTCRLTNLQLDSPNPALSKRGGGDAVRPIGRRLSRRDLPSPSSRSPVIVLTRRRRVQPIDEAEEQAASAVLPAGQGSEELSLEEMRAQLGPLGRAVAGAVEVGVVTAGSYLSGGLLGYFGGGILGVPTLFKPSNAGAPPDIAERLKAAGGFGREARGRLGNWHGRAAKTARGWAQLSAAFSGFHALARVARGGREDKWNGIIGSAATGAYLNRKAGPKAMMQSAAMYASFTYFLDVTLGNPGANNGEISDEFDYTEVPVEELN